MSQSLDPKYLRQLIKDTLTPLNLYSADVEELLMYTSANESHLGFYRLQQPSHIAKGIFQDEDEDFNDLYANYLKYHPTLMQQVNALSTVQPPTPMELVNNDKFAVVVCRAHYLRSSGSIPHATDLDGIWNYYKIHYNTIKGAATKDGADACYKKYVLQQ